MKQYVTAQEISETLGVSLTKSYAIIRELNEELQSKGYLTVRGKTSRAFFNEKWYGGQQAG
ncbi:MAG: hypothetical protein Q4C52_04770 [Eubacteriales bacterium]|nr:hypothetical protein [Eubacteriales bacterium]